VKFDLACGPGGEAGIDIVEDARAGIFRLQGQRAGGIAFDDGGKTDIVARAGAQFANDAEMVAAEGAGSDNGEADGPGRGGRH
jgi:hypothetical protein